MADDYDMRRFDEQAVEEEEDRAEHYRRVELPCTPEQREWLLAKAKRLYALSVRELKGAAHERSIVEKDR